MTPKNDHCQRCNNGLADTSKDHCKLCGWDFCNGKILSAADMTQAVAVNLDLNTGHFNNDQVLNKQKQEYKELGETASRLSETCEFIEKEMVRMKEQVNYNRQALEKKRQQKKALELQEKELKNEIAELNQYAKNAESLYKNSGAPSHARSLKLRIEGTALIAEVKAGIDFPADLVIALPPSKATSTLNISNAYFHKVINKEAWQQEKGAKWRCELGTLLAGKITPGAYYIHCVHLHPEEYNYRIEDVANKIIIA